MDRASSLIYPGSKTLAGWWRQLQPYQPHAFWVGYVFLHRVEASVHVVRVQPIEPLTHLVLQALALEPAASSALNGLQARLRLPVAVVKRVLIDMQQDGLLACETPDRWQVTERGSQALLQRSYDLQAQERRVFPFLERVDPAGQRLGAPSFLPVAECVGVPWSVADVHRFDSACLQAATAEPAEWKASRAFPGAVQALAPEAGSEAWQQVIVDRPERVLLALVRANDAELLGFAAKVDGWTLHEQTPVLRLPASTALPDLAETPLADRLQDAWRGWCRQRQLPTNEVEICALNYQPPRLDVQPPPRLLQRLQAAKSDLFKGDAWLLIGDGYMRSAVQLAIRSG